MHLEVLNVDQKELLPFLANFKKEFYLVGGTAIALHIGHRFSIDFDLFKNGAINPKRIINKFEENNEKYKITLNRDGQLNLNARNVKFTFLNYEFDVPLKNKVVEGIKIPSLLDLGAMKAYEIGRRSKWKDYVDLYFILKFNYDLNAICNRATEIFGELFSEKLFLGQLSYFEGISYEEYVEFLPGFEVSEKEVKDYLVKIALDHF